MSEEKAKKNRSANFSREEVDFLCSLVVKHAEIKESKKSDAITWEEKLQAWNNLTSEFNGKRSGLPRTMMCLKTKYETFKKDLRKKIASNKRELFKTGGGVPNIVPLNTGEQLIYDLIQPSVDGLPSRFDDDDEDNPVGNPLQEESLNNIEIEHLEDDKTETEEMITFELVEDGNSTEYPNSDINEKENKSYQCGTSGTKRKMSNWNPQSLKKPISNELNAIRKKNLGTKLQAANKINTLAHSKNELLQLQSVYLNKEIDFQSKDHKLKLEKGEEDLKNAKLEGEIKQIEKRIKEETLKKILNGNVF